MGVQDSTQTAKKPVKFSRGAEWRRWDLHVHTPASALANHFGSWDAYLDEVESAGAGVSVVGATDYCSIEGYKELLSYREQGRLASFSLILPNIEFRLQPELSNGRAINVHLLISPDDPEHVSKIERALQKLSFHYDGNPYACVRTELIALGKAHNSSIQTDTAAFAAGVNVFKPGYKDFFAWRDSQQWLKSNSLVVVANGKDGVSGLSKDAGFAAVRSELYRAADMIFSANPSDRAYFLGKGADNAQEVVRKCGSLKPCLHGSDAHGQDKLFKPDKDRFCWIKADPTFEGLRQTLHEPATRVHIGPTAPKPTDSSKIIDRLTFSDADKWFSLDEIVFNPGLVTIIGEKGSGKTALAELLAVGAGAWGADNSPSSFIVKAGDLLSGAAVTLHWVDGSTTHAPLDGPPSSPSPLVRYLSQDFVEELCSQDLSGQRLIEEIEQVVFSYLDEADRLGASSFVDLRRLKTQYLASTRADIRARLSRLNVEIVQLEDEVAAKKAKAEFIAKCDTDIAAIDAQLPQLQVGADQTAIVQLSAENQELQRKNAEIAAANLRLSRIQSARSRFAAMRNVIDEHFQELASLLKEVGLEEDQIERFRPRLDPGCEQPLNDIDQALQTNVRALRGDVGNVSPEGTTVADIQARISQLEAKLATDEQQRKRLVALQNQRSKLVAERDRTIAEVDRIDRIVTNSLREKRDQRLAAYLSYFETVHEEKTLLAALYAPLSKVIADDTSGTKAGFELSVKQTVDHVAWLESGSDLFDRRKKDVPRLSTRDFAKDHRKTILEAWETGNQSDIQSGLQALIKLVGEGPEVLDGKLVSHATRVKVYDWLFSPEHVRLEYGLKYQGVPLDALSPGTRGIVLLVLYLAMDRYDIRPLVIDQPEGNLDNSSIFSHLVPFLRDAKNHRQIILVTHNPNLVVTTDADQVVVATAHKEGQATHPTLSYVGGALENFGNVDAIRDQAVRLLEGGSTPFKMREKRYAIPPADWFAV